MVKNNQNNKIILWNREFNLDTFDRLLKPFKEGFAHSSLSVEKEYSAYNSSSLNIENLYNNNFIIFNYLSPEERSEINKTLRQMIEYLTSQYCIIDKNQYPNKEDQQRIIDDIFIEMKESLYNILEFDDKVFNSSRTFSNIKKLFPLFFEKRKAQSVASSTKKAHLKAFDYALDIDMDELVPMDIIHIGNIVNGREPDDLKTFRTSNNGINGASFETTDKSLIYPEISSIIQEYHNNTNELIARENDLYNPMTDDDDRMFNFRLGICRKIAKFHIDFIRIHPLDDGNGRTGRIIMNAMLLQNKLTPILITAEMRKKYFQCITEKDYDGFAEFVLSGSSQTQTMWTSIERSNEEIPDDEILEAQVINKRL